MSPLSGSVAGVATCLRDKTCSVIDFFEIQRDGYLEETYKDH